jgi:hypothetical protein
MARGVVFPGLFCKIAERRLLSPVVDRNSRLGRGPMVHFRRRFAAGLKNLSGDRFDAHDRAALLILVAAAVTHAGMVSVLGFSVDETYDVVMARTLALSYQDHPPAIMWLIAAAVHLSGGESHFVVRLPTLILAAAQWWLLYRLTALAFDKWSGLLALIALVLSPLFGFYIGAIAVTDGPLMFGLTAAAYVLARGLFGNRAMHPGDWLLAGIFFGIACLSKFTAILVLPGLVLFLLTVPRLRPLLLTAGPYVAALAALIVFSPVIIWNTQNGFAAFLFQGSRAALAGGIHIGRFIDHTGFLCVATGALIWLIQIGTLAGAISRGTSDEPSWFFATLATAPIAFFAAIDLFGSESGVGAHWPAAGYLFTFPLVGAAVAQWRLRFPRLVWGTIAAWVATIGIVGPVFISHAMTGWLGKFVPAINRDYDPLVADGADWVDLYAVLDRDGLLDSRHFLLIGRWEDCFKAAFELKNTLPIACVDPNPVSHSLWHDDAALLGRDAVVIASWNYRSNVPAVVGTRFANVESMPPFWITDRGRPVLRIDLAIGHNLQHPIFP